MDSSIFTYLIKVSFSLLLFYGVYVLLFRNDTLNHLKRVYLLTMIGGSFLLPLLSLSLNLLGSQAILEYILPQIQITPGNVTDSYITTDAGRSSISLSSLFSYILMGGSVLLLLKFCIQLVSLIRLRIINKSFKSNGLRLINIDRDIAPFSFFGWIFIPSDRYVHEDEKTIMAHEEVHARQMHSMDILICEILCIILWWNPLVWLIKKEVRINLEYLADEGVLKQGFEPKKYQYLLLKITSPDTSIQIVNNFNVSQLKKRIIMINKEKTQKILSMKYILNIPVVLFAIFLVIAFNSCSDALQNETEQQTESASAEVTPQEAEDKIYNAVEEMPIFPGGDGQLLTFVRENLRYPDQAVKNGVEGLVVIRFTVSKTGNVDDFVVLKSLSPECDREALRVAESMPQWQPGKNKGEPVAVYYTLPIKYQLEKD